MLRLKELRTARAWSMEQLAGRAGVTVKTIQRAERTGKVTTSTLIAIAEALEVPVGDLFAAEAAS
jgi:transcriptional regulator with XRE-family HTH domain